MTKRVYRLVSIEKNTTSSSNNISGKGMWDKERVCSMYKYILTVFFLCCTLSGV